MADKNFLRLTVGCNPAISLNLFCSGCCTGSGQGRPVPGFAFNCMEINEGVLQIRTLALQERPDNFNRAKLATEAAKRMELFFEVAPTVWLGLRHIDPWVESGNPGRGRPVAFEVSCPAWNALTSTTWNSIVAPVVTAPSPCLDTTACVGDIVDSQFQPLVYPVCSLLSEARVVASNAASADVSLLMNRLLCNP